MPSHSVSETWAGMSSVQSRRKTGTVHIVEAGAPDCKLREQYLCIVTKKIITLRRRMIVSFWKDVRNGR